MFVRLLGNLWVNRMNIPLRRFAFAARRCPPSKGEFLELRSYPIKKIEGRAGQGDGNGV